MPPAGWKRGNRQPPRPLRGALETPFPGAVLGNPQGRVTLVEFTDFACTYCRGSVADVEALVAANPDLKVVVRELPIISAQSVPAARMGLAAAAQGKYRAFHKAMFSGERPSPEHRRRRRQGRARHRRRQRLCRPARDDAGIAAQPRLWPATGRERHSGLGGRRPVAERRRERLQQAIDAARGSAARPEGA
jgi:hypothetical protein